MTNYNNFIQDFPTRCCEILDQYETDALSRGREVTLMLAMAASGFVVPFERLCPQEGSPYYDRRDYTKAASQFDRLCVKNFLNSELWKENVGSWSFDELSSVAEDPDGWSELQEPRTPLNSRKKVRDILEHLRNALAHGNIFTFPKGVCNIQFIIFLSRQSGTSADFNFLCVSPQDFQKFLKKWFVFLKKLELPKEVFSSTT